ncbi:MAG TPA: IS30 family transposase [Gaiellales bacterium]|nr:IS30 family transposase [Gaiellales bacterium]
MRGSYRWLSPAEREQVAVRVRAGDRFGDIVAAFDSSQTTVRRIADELAVARRRVGHSEHRLSFSERERISRGIAAGESGRAIARALGRAPSTVCREIKAGGGGERYRALAGERRAQRCARRAKPTKLSGSARLLAAVEQGLEARWSPQQISARLKVDHPDDLELRISHETIYQSLYVQSRGELRRQLAANLRSGRSKRRARGRSEQRGKIADMVPISQRPAEVEDRAVPGHWEGDLLIGAEGKSAIATLVERQTRYVMLARLGRDRTTANVIQALKTQIGQLPAHLARSLTWDQGKELAAHKQFTIDTDIQVYFCDPHSPWQRGSNENTNGLLRQYLPRKLDLATRSQVERDQIAAERNGRPRMTLQWSTPAENMSELLR